MNVGAALRYVVVALVALWVPAVYCVEVFQSEFRAVYEIKARGAVVGHSTWTLTKSDDSLKYMLESNTAGLLALFSKDHIVEVSEWTTIDGRLKPHEYRYDRSGGKREKQVSVDFNWEHNFVINSSKGKSWNMPVPDHAIDKLSYVIAMMHDLNIGNSSLSYSIADGGKLKIYQLERIGDESLKTAFGTLETTRMLRQRSDSDRVTTFWCSPRHRYLPVKIEHREPDGEVITGYLKSLTGLGQQANADSTSGDKVVERVD